MVFNTNVVHPAKRMAGYGYQWLRVFYPYIGKLHRFVGVRQASPPTSALNWIRTHEISSGGIRVHSGHANAYPEVTGYLVPTLLQFGDRELARRLVRWLIAIQRADGSFTDPDHGKSYIFDTGQVLRGLLSAIDIEPLAKESACRASDYLCAEMLDQGRRGFGDRYDGSISESMHLYVLPPLIEASVVLGNSLYREAADNCLEYYIAHGDALRIGDLTHFLAYQLEALIDLGRSDLALPVLEELKNVQQRGGAVRGVGGKSWVCTPGLAQLAICWYKAGYWESADKAMTWLERHQTQSGGFRGSYGQGASYFPKVELSWAAKFYLDAHRLRVLSFMERNVAIFPEDITTEDGRVQAVLSTVRPYDRIVEVGCGKGRFLKAIKSIQPDTECTGVDISPPMLAYLPDGIERLEGSLEQIPCPEDSFDVVFSVEAIEHSANIDGAIKEMIRIAKPGGWVIIVDKQRSAWGRLTCPPWERWPEAKHLTEVLNRDCDHVTSEPVGYDGKGPDGLMVAWRGQKRSRLTASQWGEVIIQSIDDQGMVDRIRYNQITEWCETIILNTANGEKVLEIGSGTGEISLFLAQAGRQVTALDYNTDSLAFTQLASQKLGLSIRTVKADATLPLPFKDDEFNCVWSSGLLEHFTSDERQKMLREWGRIAKGKIITLVPNASCISYRAGKAHQEEEGVWPYGLATPQISLRGDYDAAGLNVISEFSVGIKHALIFLEVDHPLRKIIGNLVETLPAEQLKSLNQGYLLVTIGTKKQCLTH